MSNYQCTHVIVHYTSQMILLFYDNAIYNALVAH